MIIDKLCEFADSVALSTIATGRAVFGNAIQFGNAAIDLGAGKPVYLVLSVDVAPTSGGSATVSFEFSSDAQSPIASDGTETIHYASEAIPVASLTQGLVMVIPLPSLFPVYESFVGLVINVGTAALTAGKMSAYLTEDAPGWKAYPKETS